MNKQLEAIKQARKKITPKQYSELLKNLDLVSIYLKDVKVSQFSHELSGKNSYDFGEKCSVVKHDDYQAIIEVSYSLTAKSSRKRLASVKAKYRVVFSTEKQLPGEFFTLYNVTSLPLQTFPYFRELTNSMFSRVGLPPLILPLRKYLFGEGG